MADDSETLTQQIGRELFARVRHDPAHLSAAQWLDERLINWRMRDEQIKAHLFRFIDVLPGLSSSAQVMEHLHGQF